MSEKIPDEIIEYIVDEINNNFHVDLFFGTPEWAKNKNLYTDDKSVDNK